MTRNLALTAMTCLTLFACGTPQEQCISQKTREYRSVSRLLAEAEGNLARGYAWEEREVWRDEWIDCSDYVRGKDGKVEVIYRRCLRPVRDIERYRVSFDPLVEQRKRDFLAAKVKAMTPQANAVGRACKAAPPLEHRNETHITDQQDLADGWGRRRRRPWRRGLLHDDAVISGSARSVR